MSGERADGGWAAPSEQTAEDSVYEIGRLVVDEHVTRTGKELEMRASAGAHDAIMNGLGAPGRNLGVFASVKKQSGATNLDGRMQ